MDNAPTHRLCIAVTEVSMAADYSQFVMAGLQGAQDGINAKGYPPPYPTTREPESPF